MKKYLNYITRPYMLWMFFFTTILSIMLGLILWIEARSYVKRLRKSAEEIEEKLEEIVKLKDKYKKLVDDADNEYRRIHGLMKRGKFDNFKDLVRPLKIYFKDLIKELKFKEDEK